LWVLLAAVLIVGAVVASVVVMRADDTATASEADCQVVGELAREWKAMAQVDQTGGERNEQFGGEVRAAADSVSTPALKEKLNTWADGFALLADVQRADASASSATPNDGAKVAEAGDTIYGTAHRLRDACPDSWPS
jgi:hypothetical protein